MIPTKKFQGVFVHQKKLFTKNPAGTYSLWDPTTSKVSAALHKGLKQFPFKQGSTILYLGASTGTTVAHLSNIVGKEGFIFAVELSPIVARELVFLAQERTNIAPLLADANQPQLYANTLVPVDILYQDVAQRNQVEIFLKNLQYLKKNSYAFLIIKARSIDVTKEPAQIFEDIKQQLKNHVTIIEEILLEPYQKDHCIFVCQKIN